jgi:hypothetical protein
MRKKIDYSFTIIILLLGIVHISLTPTFYESFNDEANIFIGMGLAFIFLGVLNINRLLVNQRNVTVLCLICNILAILYLSFYSIMLKKIEPQGLVTIFVILIPSLLSLINLTKKV